MGAVRYLIFIAVGALVASLLFLILNFIVSANFEASVGMVERWIIRATCDQYELSGKVRDSRGRPVAFAVVEVSYLDERLATRTNGDGSFRLAAEESVCDRRLPRNVQLLVLADDFRPKTSLVEFEAGTVEVTLEPRDLRP
jgi:hypothetical protein